MPIIIGILGIAAALVGSLLLVIAAIRHPSTLQDPFFQFGHAKVPKELLAARKMGYGNYPAEQREAAWAAADEQYKKDVEELEQKITAAFHYDRWRMVKTSLWGALFVAAGSVLQGIALLISAT